MSHHIDHHYIPKSEEKARLKGCLGLLMFIALGFAFIALLVGLAYLIRG